MLERMPVDAEKKADPTALCVYPMVHHALLGFFADTLALLNPWVDNPAPYSALASTPDKMQTQAAGSLLLRAAEAAASIALAPQFWRFDVLSKMDPSIQGAFESVPMSIMLAAKTAAGMHQHIHHPRIRLMDDERIKASLAILREATAPTWTLDVLAKGLGEGGLADGAKYPTTAAFVSLMSTSTYRKVMAAGYYRVAPAGPKEKEDPAETLVRSTAERSRRMAVMMVWIASRPFDAALRPLLWYLLHPQVRPYLERIQDPTAVALFAERATAILNRPTDPWHAEALRLYAPGTRPSPYGQSPSLGLPAHLLGDPQVETLEQSSILILPSAQVEALNLRHLYLVVKGLVDSYWAAIEDWKQVGALEPLETAIGARMPGSPAAVWTWGEQMPIIHGDGLALTKLPKDPLELMTALSLPAAIPREDPTLTPYRYTAAMPIPFYVWGDRRLSREHNLDKQITIAFEPVDPDLMLGPDVLGILPPDAIKWTNEAYKGDADATFFTASIEGVAQFMGVDTTRLQEMVVNNPIGWRHIFTVDDSGKVEVVQGKAGSLFYSSRTRRLHLRELSVPNLAPAWCATVKRGQGIGLIPVAHTLYLSKTPPVPTVSATPIISKLIDLARAPLT